jgi:FAD-dependent urate hydroxylase
MSGTRKTEPGRCLRHCVQTDLTLLTSRDGCSATWPPAPNAPSNRSPRILVVGAGVSGISVARGLLRDGHDVTVFDQRSDVQAGGGAVTIWSNGATVLQQLGVDMDGAGQQLSTVRVVTSTGRPLAALDVTTMANRLGAPVRMVPRRVLLERLLEGFPADRIRCNARATGVVSTHNGVRVAFEDGTSAQGDVLIGADGLHSIVRDVLGARRAEPTGWCSWQGMISLPGIVNQDVALMVIGKHGNLGVWPAGGSNLQWWFDLPWSFNFIRPERPIDVIRSHFAGWSDLADRVLATLTNDDLMHSPFPHFRHPTPGAGQGALTLVGDAAHIMPPTFAQGTNQALLDAMVLRKAFSDFRNGQNRWSRTNNSNRDFSSPLRWYESTRRRKVAAVSWATSQQVPHSESVLRPVAVIPDRCTTWAMTMFLRWVSHPKISAKISRDFGTETTPDRVDGGEHVAARYLWRCGDVDDGMGAACQAGSGCRVDSPPPTSA